jgi:hypothetical protein
MSEAARLLTLQFLAWLAERPRGYAETMDAWRTSCPRLSIWEDARLDGLVRLERGVVSLTDSGRAALARENAPARVAAD